MAQYVAGWETLPNQPPGYAAEVTLTKDDDGTWILGIRQSYRLQDRGEAEVMASLMRMEAANNKKAKWRSWTVPELHLRNAATLGGDHGTV